MPNKPSIRLLQPSPESVLDLRANVVIKAGPVAEGIRRLSESYQLEPAAVIRMLCADALRLRKDA